MKRTYSIYSFEESLELWKGDDHTGELVYSLAGDFYSSYKSYSYSLCLSPVKYTIVMKDEYGDGWGFSDRKSTVQFYLYDMEFYATYMPYHQSTTFKSMSTSFTLTLSYYYNSAWSYSDVPNAPSNISEVFNPNYGLLQSRNELSLYNSVTTNNYVEDIWNHNVNTFPDFTAITRYYQKVIILPFSQIKMSHINLLLSVYGGIRVFINGVFFYHYNLPLDNVNANTFAIPYTAPHSTDCVNHVISLSKYYLNLTSITILVESHHYEGTIIKTQDLFNSIAVFGQLEEEETSANFFTGGVSSCRISSSSSLIDCASLFNTETSNFNVRSSTFTIYYTMANYKSLWINQYYIRSSGYSKSEDPQNWSFYGSIDNFNWILLDTRENIVFSRRYLLYSFDLPNNHRSFVHYKLTITKSTSQNSCSLSNFYVSINNNNNILHSLFYSLSNTTFYSGITYIYLCPISTGYSDYEIFPSFMSSLSFSSTTGCITGIASLPIHSNYTVFATDSATQKRSNFTFELNVHSCSYPNTLPIKLHKENRENSFEESFTITGSSFIYSSPSFTINTPLDILICVPVDILTITLYDNSQNGWDKGSSLTILYPVGKEYQQYTVLYLEDSSSIQYVIDTYLAIPSFSSSWYSIHSNINSDWYKISSLERYPWTKFSYQESEPSNNFVGLYHTFNIPPTNLNYSSFEISFYTQPSFIFYINDINVFTLNIDPYSNYMNTTSYSTNQIDTSEETYYHITLPLSVLNKINSTNYLFIGLKTIGTSRYNLTTFNCQLLFHHITDVINHSTDMTITSQPNVNPEFLQNLLDTSLYTFWTSDSISTSLTLLFQYPSNRFEYINKYCISNSNNYDYDPYSWLFYGYDHSNQTYILLNENSKILYTNEYQTRCFYLHNSRTPYNQYKIIFTKARAISDTYKYKYTLSQIDFFSISLDYDSIPSLNFNTYSLISFVSVPFMEITPNSLFYSNFEIQPTLPSPLELDTYTGSISGVPLSSFGPVTYTIKGYLPDGRSSSTQINISVYDCKIPLTPVLIEIYGGIYAETQGFSLKYTNNTEIFNKVGFIKNEFSVYSFCLLPSIYVLEAFSTDQKGWALGSFAIYKYNKTLNIGHGSVQASTETKQFKFNIGYILDDEYTQWNYLVHTEPTNNWYMYSYNDLEWLKGTIVEINSNLKSILNCQHGENCRLYMRKRLVFSNSKLYSSMSITITTSLSFNLYVDTTRFASISHEIMKKQNVQDSDTITYASDNIYVSKVSTSDTNIVTYSILIPMSVLKHIDTHLVCIQWINEDSLKILQFSVYMELNPSQSYRIIHGSLETSNMSVNQALNLVDNNLDTIGIGGPSCTNSSFTWTYNNNMKEYITGYSLTTGRACNNRHPSGWILEGRNINSIKTSSTSTSSSNSFLFSSLRTSHDLVSDTLSLDDYQSKLGDWNVLHIMNNVKFTEYTTTNTYEFYTFRTYNQIRLTVTQCNNVQLYDEDTTDCLYSQNSDSYGVQLSDFALFSSYLEYSCAPENGFTGALNNQYTYKSCELYYEGYKRRMCINGILGPEQAFCTVATPQSVAYLPSLIYVYVDVPFTVIPIIYAAEYMCTISPELPDGVEFNRLNGKISGIVSNPFESTLFTVKCSNEKGIVQTSVFLQVIQSYDTIYVIVLCILILFIIVIIIIFSYCLIHRSVYVKTVHKSYKITYFKNSYDFSP